MIRYFIALLLAAFALSAFAAVDVNQASQAELESVKGIGPSLSGKIVQARKSANFKNWDDLVERVSGVGPGNAARLSQAGLTLSGATYEGKAVAAKPAKSAKAVSADKLPKAEKAKKTKQAEKVAA